MAGPEITFIVHPRPTSEDPRAIVDPVPATAAAAIKTRPSPGETTHERDTFLGNLAFLVRYAFGRH